MDSQSQLQEEIELINQARSDPEAFGQLYERYIERIYRYVFYRTGNVHEAQDLTERVFIKAMSNIHNYRHMGLPFSAWLYRIAHNLVANFHRDTTRKQEISLDQNPILGIKPLGDHPEMAIQKVQEIERLLELISDLPAVRQELIILKFVDNLSNQEIGKILRKTEGAVKSLYHRTLLDIRERMKYEE